MTHKNKIVPWATRLAYQPEILQTRRRREYTKSAPTYFRVSFFEIWRPIWPI